MEVPFAVQRPITSIPQHKTTPFIGTFSIPYGWQNDQKAVSISFPFTANLSRRRQRKVATLRPKDSTPRGFVPRTQQPTNNQRRDQNKDEEEGPPPSSSSAFQGSKTKTTEIKTGIHDKVDNFYQASKVEDEIKDSRKGIAVGTVSPNGPLFDDKPSQQYNKKKILKFDDDLVESKDTERVTESEEKVAETGFFYVSLNERVAEEETQERSKEVSLRGNNEKEETGKVMHNFEFGMKVSGKSRISEFETNSDNIQHLENLKEEDTRKSGLAKSEAVEELIISGKLDMAKKLCKESIENLAEKNFIEGRKFFSYPEVARPDQDIEFFFNRSFSPLKTEPDVVIMGAYNDWKWKSFNIYMYKSHLNGDWWSCKVHVPKEAYAIDFVFHNGKDIYDNNDEKDFYVTVEGGMSMFDFENFLLEEKHREQEELARQKAEIEKQAEEQRRLEADKVAKEADRTQARDEVAKRMDALKQLIKKAVRSGHDVWYIEPNAFKGGDKVRLFYNSSSGPLSQSEEIWVHGGHDGWKLGLSFISKLVKSKSKDGDWWYSDVVLPYEAVVLDWVFADGSPQKAIVFDNNNREDFHAVVPNANLDELYCFEEEKLFRKLQAERRLREEALQAKVKKTAQIKAETKARTLKTFSLSQKHIVYTDPLDVQAGSTISVFYNPADTVLKGKSDVWFRHSFNRWTHRLGTLPPQKMLPAKNSSHLETTVKVPLDAYLMDFVFSEKEDSGVFDNKNGMDYHIPVLGGVLKETPLHIVHIAVEMAPIAKVGGLGDVVTSLSRAVQDMNHVVDVILPKYDCLKYNHVKDMQFHKSYFWGGTEIKVWSGKVEGLSVYFLEPQNGLYWVGCIYGRNNDAERFGFFCHAALEFLLQSGFHPDVIHCHDWSSAPVSWLFKEHYMHYSLSKARIVFTIHNLEFGAHLIAKAMKFSDRATTVSSTYAREISGNFAVSPHIFKFHGILNGIDPDIWDPYNDNFIPVSYTSENVVEGKGAAKEVLQQKLGLRRADLPLVGIITRLTHQKGIHLIKHAIWRTLERGGQVVLLGSAPDPRIQNDFINLANQLHSSYNDCACLCLSYDEPLSHLIYAGADFVLVPSIFEPCGLTQLTAMRYGSIPVVRKTGGLYDTVFDVDHDQDRARSHGLEPNGFSFDGADAAGVDYALNRAISAWYNEREGFNSLCKRVMEQDWSWNRPALDYLELYHAARK